MLTLVLVASTLAAQTPKEQAFEKGREAIRMMDDGQIEESIKLLEECIKLDPDNLVYPYEIGYAYYISKEYQKTIDQLTPLTKRKGVSDQTYQLIGNSYDLIGQREKAINVYESGLKKLPASGRLHMELGGMYLAVKDYNQAVSYFEKGIAVEPAYPSNYYHLSKVFLDTDEEVWGMIYGEIFMNLERNSNRTAEISKRLYDTYKSEIQFTSDTSFTVSFSKNATISLDKKKIQIPYGIGVYEPTLLMEILPEKTIDINSLDRIRTRFVMSYFQNNHDKKYPNLLFSYQNQMLKLGHLEAYNHWILMKGDEDAFTLWQNSNSEKWDSFVEWFNPNPIPINDKNKFIRTQY